MAPWPESSKAASSESLVINYTSMFVFKVILIMFFRDDIIIHRSQNVRCITPVVCKALQKLNGDFQLPFLQGRKCVSFGSCVNFP